ncbi:MAG: TlpA family protein disulfide reductase, partial [Acidimicrobiales bacterium]
GEAPAPALAGTVAPRFSLEEVRSPATRVELPAGTPVVVNFFASWCAPCRDELPLLEAASRQAAGAVAFVGVDVNDSRSRAAALLAAAGVTFPAGYDPDRAVATDYRLRGMPTTVFVDASGRVADVAHGRLSAADLDRRLARLTGRSGVGTS